MQQIRPAKRHQTYQHPKLEINKPLQSGTIIANKFKLLEKVGQGSFGAIFKTENIETGEICATKFEKRDYTKSQTSLLVREIKVLLDLKGLYGFPLISFYGRDEIHNYFMLSYLGYNLEYLIRKTKSFSIMTCLKVGLQLIERLEEFHGRNLIHRDLKPENITIGWHDIDVIYLIDFGLSKYFKDSNGQHIPQSDKKGIIGTARYASISAHMGKEQSRKDDLESLSYVLIYLAKGKLPWMNIQLTDKNSKYQKILEYKQHTPLDKLCDGLPKCFYALIQHARTRSFEDAPNYVFLKEQFNKGIVEREQQEQFIGYDWERLPELKAKKKRSKSSQKQFRSKERKPSQGKPLLADKKSQLSFLNVPDIQDGTSPDRTSDNKRSRGYASHNTFCTTKLINYQISQMSGGTGQEYKKFITQQVKRKDSKSQSLINPTDGMKKSGFLKIAQQNQHVEDDYNSFDDIDQIADDETRISFQNIETFKLKKSYTSQSQL